MSDAQDRPRVIIKKKKGGHAAHHGGAWKVAYADFVTAMMALFMVLWLLTQADMKLRENIAQYFRNPGVLPGGSVINPEAGGAKSREPQVVARDIMVVQGRAQNERLDGRGAGAEARKNEQQQLEGSARAVEVAVEELVEENPQLAALKEQVIIQVTDAGLSIQVVEKGGNRDLVFDLSSADLKPPLVALLQRLAPVLASLPNPIQIGGHTDARPYPAGSAMTNWELSFKRADKARRVLEAAGVRPGQVNRVLSYADTEPLIAGDPLADENRRLSILAERRASTPCAAGDDGPVVLPPDAPPRRG
jgi:chemotaxis protein MotB